MSALPILALIEAARVAEITRLQRLAASGAPGSVAARKRMQAVRAEQLRDGRQ